MGRLRRLARGAHGVGLVVAMNADPHPTVTGLKCDACGAWFSSDCASCAERAKLLTARGDRVVAYANEQLDALLRAPEMFGDVAAVELQFLILLEVLVVARRPDLDAKPRYVRDALAAFAERPTAAWTPLAVERLAEFRGKFLAELRLDCRHVAAAGDRYDDDDGTEHVVCGLCGTDLTGICEGGWVTVPCLTCGAGVHAAGSRYLVPGDLVRRGWKKSKDGWHCKRCWDRAAEPTLWGSVKAALGFGGGTR